MKRVAASRKPNSVPFAARRLAAAARRHDDHSSSPAIADGIKRPTRRLGRAVRRLAHAPPYLVLLRAGFCLPPVLPRARCALTAPFHPYPPRARSARRALAEAAAAGLRAEREGRYIFCATFLRVALTGRYPAHCPAEFGLSSRLRAFERSAGGTLTDGSLASEVRCGSTRRSSKRELRSSGSTATVPFACLPVRLLRDLVLLELLVEIAARRIDHLGGLGDVPAVLAELADQERPFGRSP